MSAVRSGRQALLEQLIADDVRYMFGNPGTVEQGFLDTMRTYGGTLDYVFALQESIAVAAADGYARASGKLGVIQLHSSVGLGNGIGNLYQAYRGHSPLLVLTGDSGVQYDAMDAQMSGDLLAIARPVTKYAARVTHPASLLRLLRRAIKMALTPPCGPVFLNLPMDVLDAENDEAVYPACRLSTASSPSEEVVARAANLLAAATRPIILMGDGVSASGAQEELQEVATLLGAEVWGVNSSCVNIRSSFPLYRGALGHMFGFESAVHTRDADAVLICGTYVFPEVFPELVEDNVFSPEAHIVHIDLDAYEIAKNHRVDLGIVADPTMSLRALAAQLREEQTSAQAAQARARFNRIADESTAGDKAAREMDGRAISQTRASGFPFSAFAQELSNSAPDSLIFDEALTCSPELSRYIVPDQAGTYHVTRGGSLGVGFPGALGIQLARPGTTVFGVSGDGGSLYTIQSLWTAAHHRIPVKFIVANNREYRLLKLNLDEYRKEHGEPSDTYPACFTIDDPAIDFVRVAEGFGVPAERVSEISEIKPAIDRALNARGPYLLEAMVVHA